MSAPNAALEQFIKGIPLFSLVDSTELMDILRLMRPVELEAGQTLFKEGEPGKAMWVLGSGVEVSVAHTPPGGKRQVVVAYAKAGDVIGEMALVDDGPRSGTAVVVQGGHAHEIVATEFHALRGAFHSAAFKVLRRICIDLCSRLRATNERIVPSSAPGIRTPPPPNKGRPQAELLDQFAPFATLPAVVKLALAQKLQLIEVSELTPLFAENEETDGAYFLVEGEVSVGRNGKTLANLVPGTMFGLVSAIDLGRRSASCITTGPAKLLKLSERDFDALFSAGNRFAFQLVDLAARQLVDHLRQANAMLPMPGKTQGAAAATAKPVPTMLPNTGEGTLDALDVIPLELEMDLETEFSTAADILG